MFDDMHTIDQALGDAENDEWGTAFQQLIDSTVAGLGWPNDRFLRFLAGQAAQGRSSGNVPSKERSLFRRTPVRNVVAAAVVILLAVFGMAVASVGGRTARVATAQDILNKAAKSALLVPPGRVRHLVQTYATSSAGTFRQDQWIANGREHLLMRRDCGPGGGVFIVGDDVIWHYFPGAAQARRSPYDPSVQQGIAPTGLPADPDAHVVGRGTLNGRDVTEVKVDARIPPPALPAGAATPPPGVLRTIPDIESETLVLWIDSKTFQTLQSYRTLKDASGRPVQETDWTVTVNESLDARQVPSDLFTFSPPPGTTVIEGPWNTPLVVEPPQSRATAH